MMSTGHLSASGILFNERFFAGLSSAEFLFFRSLNTSGILIIFFLVFYYQGALILYEDIIKTFFYNSA